MKDGDPQLPGHYVRVTPFAMSAPSMTHCGGFNETAPHIFSGRVTIFSAVAASTVGVGAAKVVKNISLTMSDFAPVKTVAQVVLSQEAINSLEDEGLRILGNQLKNSVAVGSDSAFLAALAGESGEAQGLDTWQGVNDDLEELLRDLRLGAGSKPFLIMTPNVAKGLAAKAITIGVDSLRWDGGEYLGVPILVSDAQTAGRITAVDATGLAIVLGDLELRSSAQALVEIVDASSRKPRQQAPARRWSACSRQISRLAC